MKFEFKGQQLYINKWLAESLDSVVYNIKKDWDFCIVISGNRTVRVGKSVLAQTIGAYLYMRMTEAKIKTDFTLDDVYFDNRVMMKRAMELPPHSIQIYDEGREGLSNDKNFSQVQRDLLDFFAECGQLNHVFIIVAPDFFELKEIFAVARSQMMINVYVDQEEKIWKLNGKELPVTKLVRGNFQFFDRRQKQLLYDYAKTSKRRSYFHSDKKFGWLQPNFKGNFIDQSPFDKELYKKKKRDALGRFAKEKEDKEKSQGQNAKKARRRLGNAIKKLVEHTDLPQKIICNMLDINEKQGSQMVGEYNRFVEQKRAELHSNNI